MTVNSGNALTPLQHHFLHAILEGKREISEEEAVERSVVLGLTALRGPFMVACIAPYYSSVNYREKDKLIRDCADYVWKWLNREGTKCYCLVNAYDNIQVIMALENREASKEADEVFISLRDRLQLHFELDLFIGIGAAVDRISEIASSAADAHEMLAYKYQYADRGVINICNLIRFAHNLSYGGDIRFERVLGCFKDGDLGRMSIRLQELIDEIRYRPNVSRTAVQRTMIELTVNILHIASNANVNTEEVLHGLDPYRWILEQENTEQQTEWLMKLSAELLERMRAQQENQERTIIQIACQYIEEHLGDPDTGLQTVSEAVGLSAPYFSQLFKKEKKIGLNNYISTVRVERAEELLSKTDMKSSDIALQLGFASMGYFSQVFKRITGIPPLEYRKTKKNRIT